MEQEDDQEFFKWKTKKLVGAETENDSEEWQGCKQKTGICETNLLTCICGVNLE